MSERSLSSPKLNLKMSAIVTNTLDDASAVTVSQPNLAYSKTLTSGVSDSQANRGWQSLNRAIASGQQETLDLYDLAAVDIGADAGRDAVGQLVVFEEIVAIAIVNENLSTAAGQLEILPAASEGWTPIGSHTVANGGALYGQGVLLKCQVAEAGFDVALTSHRVTLRAVGGSVDYSIYLLARHDDEESSSSSSSVSSLSSSSSSLSSSFSSSSSSSLSASTSSISTSSSSSSSISTSSSSVSSSSSSSMSNSSSSSSSQSSSSLSS